MVDLICDSCGKPFRRRRAEVNRSQIRGRKQYCGRTCAGRESMGRIHLTPHPENLVASNRGDQYSRFRSHLNRLRNRKHEVTVTLHDLKDLWDEQRGVCPLTGWEMILHRTTALGGQLTPMHASLDRIDSSLGYTRENVRWVSVMANFCKNGFTDDEVIEFAHAVAQTRPYGVVDNISPS